MKVYGESVSVRAGPFTHLGYLAAGAEYERGAHLLFSVVTAVLGGWLLLRMRKCSRAGRLGLLVAAVAAFALCGLFAVAPVGPYLPRMAVNLHGKDARDGFRALGARLQAGSVPPSDTGELRRAWGLDPRDLVDAHGNDLQLRRATVDGRETWALVGAGEDGRFGTEDDVAAALIGWMGKEPAIRIVDPAGLEWGGAP